VAKKAEPVFVPGQAEYSLTWAGYFVSLNKIWEQRHWNKRKELKDSFARHFFIENWQKYKKEFPRIKGTYRVEFFYSDMIDIDNSAVVIKMFLDFARREGIVEDDSPHYLKDLRIVHRESKINGEHISTIKIIPFDYESIISQ
jgi:hypothetical protein